MTSEKIQKAMDAVNKAAEDVNEGTKGHPVSVDQIADAIRKETQKNLKDSNK